MCHFDVFTDVYPDGRTAKYRRPTLCKYAHNGQPCSNARTYEHPPRPASNVSGQYVFPGGLPTPRDSPRPGSSSRESGNESDRSSRRGTKRTKRTVYIDGKKVVESDGPAATSSKPVRPKANSSERIVIVDAPPTARTPPQVFTFPHTAPPSPSTGYSPHPQPAQPHQLYPGGVNIMTPSPRLSPMTAAFPHSYTPGIPQPYGPTAPLNSPRPIIVDERHRPAVETRHASSSSRPKESKEARHERRERHHSREGSSTSTSSVESERRRRREAEAALRETRAELENQRRQQRIAERIRLANAEIAARRAVPLSREQQQQQAAPRHTTHNTTASAAMPKAPAPPSPLKRAATGFATGSASHRSESVERELAEAVRRLDLAKRAKKERERAEESARERRRLETLDREGLRTREAREAEEARLRERMMPRRRFTVGPGNRRQRATYEDGVYRWE